MAPKSELFTIMFSLLLAIVTAYFISEFDTQTLKEQIGVLKDQNSIQGKELDDQKQKTIIMNQTLHTTQQSQEKKSLISVKILPHVEFPSDKYVGFEYQFGPGSHYTRKIHVENTSLNLIGNKNYTFDIVITNIGSDTAILNYYAFEVIQAEDHYSSEQERDYDINKILRSNSDPLIIKHNVTTTNTFAPNGTFYFTVVYDNGAAESGAIPYVYSER